MGEKTPNREESPSGQLPCCGCPLPAQVPAWTVEPAGRGMDLPPRGAGQRPQSLESHGARQEVDLSEAGACKTTLGPERKTSGCGGECGELNGGQGRGYPHTAPLCKLDRAHLSVDVVLPLCHGWWAERGLGLSCLLPPRLLCARVSVQDANYAAVHGSPGPRQQGRLLSSRP